jgi:hypothetical protein
LGEINLFAAGFAGVVFIEFIGKDFDLRGTGRAFAFEKFKMLMLLESGTVLGGVGHGETSFRG